MLDDRVECVGEAVTVVRFRRNNRKHGGTLKTVMPLTEGKNPRQGK